MLSDLLGLAVVFAFALIPGAGLAIGLARRLHFSITKTLPFAFAVSVAITGLLSLFGVGLRLQTATILFVAASALAWVLGYFLGRGQDKLRTGGPGLWLGLAVTVVTMIERPWYGRAVDTFYHLAAVRSLLVTGQAIPTDPIYGVATSAPDPTSGALHTLMAMWSYVSHVDPEVLWVGVTALGASLTVMAFWALARRLSGSDRAATWAALGFWLLVMFGDGRAFGYPNRLSFALVFSAMTALVELADRGSWPASSLAAIALFAAGAVHLGSALLAIVFAVCLVFWKIVYAIYQHFVHGKVELMPLVWTGGSVIGTLLLMMPLILLRAAPVAASNLQLSVFYPLRFMSLIGPVGIILPPPEFGGWLVFSFATALVVLIVTHALLHRDRVALAATAVAGIALLVTLNPIVASLLAAFAPYSIARLDALLGFTPWIAVAWGVSRTRHDSPPQVLLLTAVTVTLAVIIGLPFLRTAQTPWPAAYRRGETTWWGQSFFSNLRRDLVAPGIDQTRRVFGNTYPIVAGDPATVYALIASVPARAAAVPRSHSQFSVEAATGMDRRADMLVLLEPETSADDRRSILSRWNATYVALDLSQQDEAAAYPGMLAQPQLFEPVVQQREFALLKVVGSP